MTRTPVGAITLSARETTVNYPVWLTEEQFENVRRSFTSGTKGWGEWSADAYARLMREDPSEIASLLNGYKRTKRDGKVALPCRIRKDVLDSVRSTSQLYKCTMQAVLSTAFTMHALAPVLSS